MKPNLVALCVDQLGIGELDTVIIARTFQGLHPPFNPVGEQNIISGQVYNILPPASFKPLVEGGTVPDIAGQGHKFYMPVLFHQGRDHLHTMVGAGIIHHN